MFDKLRSLENSHAHTAPFPAAVARRYSFPAAAAVGVLFGAVRAQDVRPLCESWAVWADARLGSIAAAWKAALP